MAKEGQNIENDGKLRKKGNKEQAKEQINSSLIETEKEKNI